MVCDARSHHRLQRPDLCHSQPGEKFLGPRGPLVLPLVDPPVRPRLKSVKEYLPYYQNHVYIEITLRGKEKMSQFCFIFFGLKKLSFFIFLGYVGPSVAVLIHPGR